MELTPELQNIVDQNMPPAAVPAAPVAATPVAPAPVAPTSDATNAPHPSSFAGKIATNAEKIGIRPGQNGGWAKSLVGAAVSALSDADVGVIPEGGGALEGIAHAMRNRQERMAAAQAQVEAQKQREIENKRADVAAQDAHEHNRIVTAHVNAQMTREQALVHMLGDKQIAESIEAGKAAVNNLTTSASPSEIIAQGLTSDELQGKIARGELDPTKNVAYPTGRKQTGENTDGTPIYRTTYSIIADGPSVKVDAKNAADISKYTATPITEGQQLTSAQFNWLSQQVANNKAATAARDKALADAGLAKDKQDQSLEVIKIGSTLNPYLVETHGNILEAERHMAANPKIAEQYPHLHQDIVQWWGEKNYAELVKLQEQAKSKREEIILKAVEDAKKRQADLSDHTDAFGNTSPLGEKEFNKRYDSFTSSNQRKTLLPLEGTYQQLTGFIDDISKGRPINGPESVVALFAAIGISATPLAGKGFRINQNTIEEHVGARGLDQSAIAKLKKLTTGALITDQQIKDYSKIAVDVYRSAYVNAAHEQIRTMGYTDILPRGNNQPIDSVTHSMYLQIAGGDQQKAAQAERKMGWAVPPAGITVTDPSGGIHTFSDQASANNFKKLAGIK